VYTANVEENASISKALSRLSEVESKVHDLHNNQVIILLLATHYNLTSQVAKDTFVFGETIKDHIYIIGAIKVDKIKG